MLPSIALASLVRRARTRLIACFTASTSACGVTAVVALASGMPVVGGGAYAMVMAWPAGAACAAAASGSGPESERLEARAPSRVAVVFVELLAGLSCACLAGLSAGFSAVFLSALF